MRGAPQRGLAAAILHTKSLSSRLIPGRPDRLRREIQVQNRRNPRRCQLTTVSGRTRSNDFCQFGQNRARQTQNQRSAPRTRGLGRCLFITASCCRRARFSKVNSLRRAGRTRSLMTENKSLNMHLREIIDVAAKKIVATLQDEAGRQVQSEKMLDLTIANGKVVRAGSQFGIGIKRK